MTDSDFSLPLEIGIRPELMGRRCNGFLLNQMFEDGRLLFPADIIYVRVDDEWHRLVLDASLIMWEPHPGDPQPGEAMSDEFEFRLHNLAKEGGFLGLNFSGFSKDFAGHVSRVEFCFADGRRIVFEGSGDRTHYTIA